MFQEENPIPPQEGEGRISRGVDFVTLDFHLLCSLVTESLVLVGSEAVKAILTALAASFLPPPHIFPFIFSTVCLVVGSGSHRLPQNVQGPPTSQHAI